MLKLSEKDFKAAIIKKKMFQQPITNSFNKWKIENLSKEPKVIKEPNGNIKLKNTKEINKIPCWMGSIVKLRWYKLEAENWDILTDLPNLKQREK